MAKRLNNTFKKTFKDQRILDRMLQDRQKWSLKSLGIFYGVDFKSIEYQCKKKGVEPPADAKEFSIPRILTVVNIQGHRPPASYAEYVARSKGYPYYLFKNPV